MSILIQTCKDCNIDGVVLNTSDDQQGLAKVREAGLVSMAFHPQAQSNQDVERLTDAGAHVVLVRDCLFRPETIH